MKVQLINYMTYPKVEIFGTCDLCETEGVANYPTYEFKSGDDTWKVKAWFWDFDEYYEIHTSIIQFALWLQEQDVDELPRDYYSLKRLVFKFQEETRD